jgi:predicted metalloprotease
MANWDNIGSIGDVEDRRGASPLLLGGGGLGLIGVVVVLAFNLLTGGSIDLNSTLNQLQQTQVAPQSQSGQFAGEDSYEKFAGHVLGSTNEAWSGIFAASGKQYHNPKLVLFRSYTPSACGGASSEVGPHYCPADQTIYLDETFFDEMTNRLGASKEATGDVAQAYVIAHEVGHHVQNQLGTMDQLGGLLGSNSPDANVASVKLELQADCFAGVWAHAVSSKGIFEPNEVNEALAAAASVGDDRIQKAIQGRVTPETWTHGSSEQRVQWFNNGYKAGKPADCNTFAT